MATLMELKQEFVVWLRNSDILTTTERGVTYASDGFELTSPETTFQISYSNVKNVIAVTDPYSVVLEYGKDYTFDYDTYTVTIINPVYGAPNDYSIEYYHGNSDKIFPDFPQANLKLSQFPRVAVDILSGTSNEIGIGADITQSEYVVTVIAYAESQTEVEDIISSVKTATMNDKKNMYYASFMTPTTLGPLLVSEFGQKKIVQRNQDINVRFIFEN